MLEVIRWAFFSFGLSLFEECVQQAIAAADFRLEGYKFKAAVLLGKQGSMEQFSLYGRRSKFTAEMQHV